MAGTWGLQFFLLCLTPALSPAVKIKAKGREVIYLAKGESVKLGCPYELEPQDDGPNGLDIEWTQMNSDPTNLDHVILSYHDQQVMHPEYQFLHPRGAAAGQDASRFGHPGFQQNSVVGDSGDRLGSNSDCCADLQQRINFAMPDPSNYDASINLQNVQITDSATYECKVKKTTVASRKVTVMVLERPSSPKCSISGKVAIGQEVTLRCASQAGSPPLVYRWAKIADPAMGNGIPSSALKGSGPGDLLFEKLSQDHLGVYQCSVSNKVGSARCSLELSLSKDSNLMSIILGGVLGSLLLLLLLLCLISGLVYCCKRKRPKEESQQIRVDTAPPRARGESRNSSLRSVLGYLPHNISFGQRKKYESPKEQEGIEMLSPNQDAEPGSGPRPSGRETPAGGHPSAVTTKARVHYDPSGPFHCHAKSSTPGTSNPPAPASPNSGAHDSTTCERETGQGRRCHPGQYGGIPVMMPAKTREGLVI